jgi:hypothetical protein
MPFCIHWIFKPYASDNVFDSGSLPLRRGRNDGSIFICTPTSNSIPCEEKPLYFFLKFEQLNLYRMMNLLTPVAEPPCSYWVHMNPIKLAYSLYKHYIFNGYMYFKSSL